MPSCGRDSNADPGSTHCRVFLYSETHFPGWSASENPAAWRLQILSTGAAAWKSILPRPDSLLHNQTQIAEQDLQQL